MFKYKMRLCPLIPSIILSSLPLILSPSSNLSQDLYSELQMEEDASISRLLHPNPQAF